MTDKIKEAIMQEMSDIGQEIEMNIKELAEQAGMTWSHPYDFWAADNEDLERFAELVRQEEREVCGKMLENKYTNGDNCECWLESMAEEIRGRTE